MKEDVKRLEQQLKVQSSDHETQLLRMRSEVSTCTYVYYSMYMYIVIVCTFFNEHGHLLYTSLCVKFVAIVLLRFAVFH